MSDSVAILRYQRKHWDGSTANEYSAWCEQCLRSLSGENGQAFWATKATAVKYARAHLARHPGLQSYLDRITADGRTKVVDTITAY